MDERQLRWVDRPLTKISQRAAGFPKPGGQVLTLDSTGLSHWAKADAQRRNVGLLKRSEAKCRQSHTIALLCSAGRAEKFTRWREAVE
jgi:hypothetical protein